MLGSHSQTALWYADSGGNSPVTTCQIYTVVQKLCRAALLWGNRTLTSAEKRILSSRAKATSSFSLSPRLRFIFQHLHQVTEGWKQSGSQSLKSQSKSPLFPWKISTGMRLSLWHKSLFGHKSHGLTNKPRTLQRSRSFKTEEWGPLPASSLQTNSRAPNDIILAENKNNDQNSCTAGKRKHDEAQMQPYEFAPKLPSSVTTHGDSSRAGTTSCFLGSLQDSPVEGGGVHL